MLERMREGRGARERWARELGAGGSRNLTSPFLSFLSFLPCLSFLALLALALALASPSNLERKNQGIDLR